MVLPPARVLLVDLLLVGSTVVWRRGDIFSGSLDPVVVGKAVLSITALVLAFAMAHGRGSIRLRLGTGTAWFLGLLLTASMLGALAHGTVLASAVATLRVVIVAMTVFLLLRVVPALVVLEGAVWACGAVAAVAAATGLSGASAGRLFGGIPPLNPNQLALLAAVVVLWIAWRIVLGEARVTHALLAVGYLGVVWLTGSRTALFMMLAGIAVMVVHIRRARIGLVVGTLVALASAPVVAMSTGAFVGFVERNGTGTSTLDSRFIAWNAARSWADSAWQWAFGGGLSVKLIPVKGQWWNNQLLDSSWVSALVQAGLVGLLVTALWALWALRGAWLAPRRHRILFLGFLVFLIGRSVLESGLFDATPDFVFFAAVSMLAEGGSRASVREQASTSGTRISRQLVGDAPGAIPSVTAETAPAPGS